MLQKMLDDEASQGNERKTVPYQAPIEEELSEFE